MALILIVDDSPTEVFVVRKMLEKHDHQVIVAENGEKAIKMANEKRPSLILMDVVMPDFNGFQATRALSKDPNTSNIPIIIISTKDEQTDKTWGLRQGAKSYLIKPVPEDTLIKEINQLLGFNHG
jgi:twitching motility two-component system response regulator PilH